MARKKKSPMARVGKANGRWKGGVSKTYYRKKAGAKKNDGKIVHHKDHNKKNSSKKNLVLVTPAKHNKLHPEKGGDHRKKKRRRRKKTRQISGFPQGWKGTRMKIADYTKEQREMIKKRVMDALDKSFDVNKFGKGTPFWMSLLFILERFNKGNYYGSLELKILGTSANDVKEKERTHKLLETYTEPE